MLDLERFRKRYDKFSAEVEIETYHKDLAELESELRQAGDTPATARLKATQKFADTFMVRFSDVASRANYDGEGWPVDQEVCGELSKIRREMEKQYDIALDESLISNLGQSINILNESVGEPQVEIDLESAVTRRSKNLKDSEIAFNILTDFLPVNNKSVIVDLNDPKAKKK